MSEGREKNREDEDCENGFSEVHKCSPSQPYVLEYAFSTKPSLSDRIRQTKQGPVQEAVDYETRDLDSATASSIDFLGDSNLHYLSHFCS